MNGPSMVAAAAIQAGASPLSAIVSALSSLFSDPPAPARTAPSQGDAFQPQYSPQVYNVVANSSGAHFSVLEANTYTLNIAFPPLIGTPPGFIPSLPPATPLPEQTIIAGTERQISVPTPPVTSQAKR